MCEKFWPFCSGLNMCINSSDTEDRIFQVWGSIPCLLMPWLLKSPGHQQAWYWLCRTDNMYCCSRLNLKINTWSNSLFIMRRKFDKNDILNWNNFTVRYALGPYILKPKYHHVFITTKHTWQFHTVITKMQNMTQFKVAPGAWITTKFPC